MTLKNGSCGSDESVFRFGLVIKIIQKKGEKLGTRRITEGNWNLSTVKIMAAGYKLVWTI